MSNTPPSSRLRRSPTPDGQSTRLAALHDEIARLPERYREPILLCHLEGLSTAAAAQRLGCGQGTILSRLSRARQRLRRRLSERGQAVPAGLWVASEAPHASAVALPAALVNSTVRAALPTAGQATLAATVSPSVAVLTQTGLRAIFMTRITMAASLLATAAVSAALIFPIVRPSLAAVSTAAPGGSQSRPADDTPHADLQDQPAQPPLQGSGVLPSLPVKGRLIALNSDEATSLAFSPDGRTLAAAGQGKTINLWDVVTGTKIRQLAVDVSINRPLAFSPDGKVLVSVGDEGNLRFWDVARGTQTRPFPGPMEIRLLSRSGPDPELSVFAFSPDGSLVAAGGEPGISREMHDGIFEVTVFDLRTGYQVWSHMGRGERPLALAFAPGGEVLASAGGPAVRLWNTRTGDSVRKITSKGGILTVAFTPDGRTLAGGGFAGGDAVRPPEGFITLWSVATGEVLHTLDRHTGEVRVVAVAPDGKTFAGGGGSVWRNVGNEKSRVSEVNLWVIATGKLLWTFEAEAGDLNALAFAPDGKAVAYADQEAIGLIDVQTGRRTRTLQRTTRTPRP